MTTLTNSFHNSQIKVRKTEEQLDNVVRDLMTARGHKRIKAKRYAANCKRKLCGVKGCTCGDDLGRR